MTAGRKQRRRVRDEKEDSKGVVGSSSVSCKGQCAVIQTRRDGSTEVVCPQYRHDGDCEVDSWTTGGIESCRGSGTYNWLNTTKWHYHSCNYKKN